MRSTGPVASPAKKPLTRTDPPPGPATATSRSSERLLPLTVLPSGNTVRLSATSAMAMPSPKRSALPARSACQRSRGTARVSFPSPRFHR